MGLVFECNIPGFTHASHPCAVHFKNDTFVLAFTCRDSKQRSHIFLCYAEFVDDQLKLLGEPKLALSPGETGTFDGEGVISVCFVQHKGATFLYYVGWQNLPEKMWLCDTGRAIADLDQLTLKREFTGPVFGRDKHNPLFVGATAFQIVGDLWHTWYNSGIRWEKTESGYLHYYGIHHGTSKNGIDWTSEPNQVLPFKDKYEYAFGRPTVVRVADRYLMWFAHRASKAVSTYRIGFASSTDGLKWDRNDSLAGIDVSDEGWDSEMICYPYVLMHKQKSLMLYNGNSYGKTGFGLAVMAGMT